MSDMKRLRRHLFVDPKVQGGLVFRVVAYWLICLASVFLMSLCWQILTGPSMAISMRVKELWANNGLVLMACLVLLPLVVYDIVRFSNRFVGPLLRLRRSMRQLARGERVDPIEFRGNDFWQDFAGEFNAVRVRILLCSPAKPQEQDETGPQEQQRQPTPSDKAPAQMATMDYS